VYPYLLTYGSSALFTNGKSLIFGTPEFWSVSPSLAIVTHLWEHRGADAGHTGDQTIGSSSEGELLWWAIGSDIAWGVGYPLSEQFLSDRCSGRRAGPFICTGNQGERQHREWRQYLRSHRHHLESSEDTLQLRRKSSTQ